MEKRRKWAEGGLDGTVRKVMNDKLMGRKGRYEGFVWSQVNVYFWRSKGKLSNKVGIDISCKSSNKVQEGLLKLIIALCRNFTALEILFPMGSNLLCFDLPIFYIHLVST